MSDVGLQTLTAPIRIMMKRGLSNLQVLDLSRESVTLSLIHQNVMSVLLVVQFYFCFHYTDNPISERAIGYLACLPKVEKLDLSGTKLRVSLPHSDVIAACNNTVAVLRFKMSFIFTAWYVTKIKHMEPDGACLF